MTHLQLTNKCSIILRHGEGNAYHFGHRPRLGKHRLGCYRAAGCALVVRGAARCDVAKECLAAGGPTRRRIRCGNGEPSHRAAELTLDDYAQVTEIFQANPELLHRLWKGVDDASAAVWFTRETEFVHVFVVVTDDVDAKEDAVAIRINGQVPIHMDRLTRTGLVTKYAAQFPSARLPATVAGTVDDDDGEGMEVKISETVELLK